MKLGLFGPTNEQRSANFDGSRTINLFPVISEVKGSKSVAALYGTPGLKPFASSVGDGPIRGVISCGNGRAFVVSGNAFFEILSDGSKTSRGTLSTFTGTVSLAENGLQIMLATGSVGYIFTFATNAFVQITDVDFPGADYVTFGDGYFIVTPPNNLGKFNISSLYDGLTWDALDFATAEGTPDGLVAAFANAGMLYLFGNTTTEIWYNNGSADFPYSRMAGGRMEIGAQARFSITKTDNTVFWLGQDGQGSCMVYRANGVTPLRISKQSVEYALNKALKEVGSLDDLIGFTYQQEGHLFYVLTGRGLESAWVYDAATQMWHERKSNVSDTQERWLAVYQMYAFNKNLVGDRLAGNIYEIDLDTYTDNGAKITRTRRFTPLFNEGEHFAVSALEVDFDGGVGNADCPNPLAWLRMSRDAYTWSSEYYASIGAQGNYGTRCVWRRLGVQQQMTFEVSISDPVKVIISGGRFRGA